MRSPAPRPVTLADVYDAVAVLRGEIAELRAAVAPSAPSSTPPRDYLSVEEAADLVGRSPQCVTGWCRAHRIGVMVHGRWHVDRAHLRRYLVERFGEARLPAGLR